MSIAKKMAATVSSVAVLVAASGAAMAQEADTAAPAEPAAPEMTAPAPATDFNQAQIEAFAVAYLQVMDIGMAAEQQLQSATSEEDQMAVQMQAQEQMVTAVEGVEGISVDEYNALLTAAQADPVLAEQVQGEVDSLVEGN